MFDAFDILRKLPDGGIVWVETANTLESAREQIKFLAGYRPGEYVIFSQSAQSIISTPWVTYAAEAEPTDCRRRKVKAACKKETKKKEPKGKGRGADPGTCESGNVVADAVAEMARAARHK